MALLQELLIDKERSSEKETCASCLPSSLQSSHMASHSKGLVPLVYTEGIKHPARCNQPEAARKSTFEVFQAKPIFTSMVSLIFLSELFVVDIGWKCQTRSLKL